MIYSLSWHSYALIEDICDGEAVGVYSSHEKAHQEMVDNVVEDRVNDVLRDPISFIREMGLDIKNFINEKDLAEALVESDGWGVMNGYDGNYDSESVNDETYYVMRVE